jgi:hypothetical protein
MSKGVWQRVSVLGALLKPEETESGSAGTQPDKGYPGLRCAKGTLGRWRSNPPSSRLCSCFGHRSHASQILLRNPWLGHDLTRARFRRMNHPYHSQEFRAEANYYGTVCDILVSAPREPLSGGGEG